MSEPDRSVLDNPAWWALTGAQRHLGTTTPLAARFHPDISPFGALADEPGDAHWDDLADVVGAGGTVALIVADRDALRPGPGWTLEWELAGVQMVADGIGPGPDPAPPPSPGTTAGPSGDATDPLGPSDVDDMLALVAAARPGPFLSRTIEFGGYVGIRRQGRLVAMAGLRLRPPGYAEVSAVATDPGYRRQGLARVVVRAVTEAVVRGGEAPMLHAAATNVDAIRLYESMGFSLRARPTFVVVRAPGDPAAIEA